MKIAIVVLSFPVKSETFIVNKVCGLLDRGIDVKIIVLNSHSGDWEAFPGIKTKINPKLHILHAPPHSNIVKVLVLLPFIIFALIRKNYRSFFYLLNKYFQEYGFSVRALKKMYFNSVFMLHDFDLLHFEFGSLAAEYIDIIKHMNYKAVVSFRGFDINFTGLAREDYYREVFENAACIHVISEFIHQKIIERGCPSEVPVALIPPAIDTGIFSRKTAYPTKLKSCTFNVLSVARLVWQKGFEYIIQAMQIVHLKGYKFHYYIAGEGSYEPALRFAIDQLGLTDIVSFVGYKKREELLQYYESADIILHGSIVEGFCNTVLEGQSMGVPVVSSDAGALSENIEDSVTGYIVPRRNPYSMAEKIIFLMERPEIREQMSKNGQLRVRKYFKIEDQIEAFIQMYKTVLNRENIDGQTSADENYS